MTEATPWLVHPAFLLRLACAAAAGTVIGFERQWSRHLAGLQTNALVASGSALFVLMSEFLSSGAPDTRIAAQIVTGVGFLGSGVIIRDGVHVRGLNTAATLWCAAGAGALAGYGRLAESAVATAAVVAINIGLRALSHHMEQRSAAQLSRYRLRVAVETDHEGELRAALIQLANLGQLTIDSIDGEVLAGGVLELKAVFSTPESARGNAAAAAMSGLAVRPGVRSVSWETAD